MKITMIGSCFNGFVRGQMEGLIASGGYPEANPLDFQTCTTWQRIDAIVDILSGNIPDRSLVEFYIRNGYWELNKPLGIEMHAPIQTSEWFARRILEENSAALGLVNDTPDLLLFDSLSDWRHPLYRHRRKGWKCFLGRILFMEEGITRRFDTDFEFIELLNPEEINGCIRKVDSYFRARNKDLKSIYMHFPVLPGYLEEKWVRRAEALKASVSLLAKQMDRNRFMQLAVPEEIIRPLTDPSHPNYSRNIWNHFHDDLYLYCARAVLDWYVGKSSVSPA